MTKLNWEKPYEINEHLSQKVAVWCPTYELAEEFLQAIDHPAKRVMLKCYNLSTHDDCFFLDGKKDWMHGPRDSLDGYWYGKGYRPRQYYQCPPTSVEVGDLL